MILNIPQKNQWVNFMLKSYRQADLEDAESRADRVEERLAEYMRQCRVEKTYGWWVSSFSNQLIQVELMS